MYELPLVGRSLDVGFGVRRNCLDAVSDLVSEYWAGLGWAGLGRQSKSGPADKLVHT